MGEEKHMSMVGELSPGETFSFLANCQLEIHYQSQEIVHILSLSNRYEIVLCDDIPVIEEFEIEEETIFLHNKTDIPIQCMVYTDGYRDETIEKYNIEFHKPQSEKITCDCGAIVASLNYEKHTMSAGHCKKLGVPMELVDGYMKCKCGAPPFKQENKVKHRATKRHTTWKRKQRLHKKEIDFENIDVIVENIEKYTNDFLTRVCEMAEIIREEYPNNPDEKLKDCLGLLEYIYTLDPLSASLSKATKKLF